MRRPPRGRAQPHGRASTSAPCRPEAFFKSCLRLLLSHSSSTSNRLREIEEGVDLAGVEALVELCQDARLRSPSHKLSPRRVATLQASSFAVRPGLPAIPALCVHEPKPPQPRGHLRARASIHNALPPAP